MPTYDFKCPACKAIKTDVILSIRHEDSDHPVCCFGEPMDHHITVAPMVHWKDYDLPDGGFKAAHDGTVITTRKQNLEYMERHGLQDANEVYEKPTYESEQRERAESQAAIDNITPTADEIDLLKDAKIIDEAGELITDY